MRSFSRLPIACIFRLAKLKFTVSRHSRYFYIVVADIWIFAFSLSISICLGHIFTSSFSVVWISSRYSIFQFPHFPHFPFPALFLHTVIVCGTQDISQLLKAIHTYLDCRLWTILPDDSRTRSYGIQSRIMGWHESANRTPAEQNTMFSCNDMIWYTVTGWTSTVTMEIKHLGLSRMTLITLSY